jgi:hypothetical protein
LGGSPSDDDDEGDRDERLPATSVRVCDACHLHKERVEAALQQGALQDAADLVARHEAWRAPAALHGTWAGRQTHHDSHRRFAEEASADGGRVGSAAAELWRLKRRALPLVLRSDGVNGFGPGDGVGDLRGAAAGRPARDSSLTAWLLQRAHSEAPAAEASGEEGSGGAASPCGHDAHTGGFGGGRGGPEGEDSDAELRLTVALLRDQLKFKSSQAQQLRDQLSARQGRPNDAANGNGNGSANGDEGKASAEAAALRLRVRELEALAIELQASAPDLFQRARGAAQATLQQATVHDRGTAADNGQVRGTTPASDATNAAAADATPEQALPTTAAAAAAAAAGAGAGAASAPAWVAAGSFTFNPAAGGAGVGLSKTLRVTRVDAGSAAARASVLAGFRVVSLGTTAVRSLEEFRACLAEHSNTGAGIPPSTRLVVGLERPFASTPEALSVTTARRAAEAAARRRRDPTAAAADAAAVLEVLRRAGCLQFAAALAGAGVATVAQVAALCPPELAAFGFKTAHARKLQRALSDYSQAAEAAAVPLPGAAAAVVPSLAAPAAGRGRKGSSPRSGAVAGRRSPPVAPESLAGGGGVIAFLLGAR